jgi:LDH2 family malate/lactate/ureidoglycolate dehydrogenase
MRGGGALAAFVSAYSAASGQNPIVAAFDSRSALDPTGAARAAVAELLGGAVAGAPQPAQSEARPLPAKPGIGVLVLAIDNAAIADEAARKASGMTVFADASSWGERSPDSSLYSAAIKGDEAGLARTAAGLARRLASGRDEPAPALVRLRFKTVFPKIF